jgi:hypothetical protein
MEFQDGGVGIIYASNNAIPGKWINDYHIVTEKITASFSDANNAEFIYTAEATPRTEVISSDKNLYIREVLNLYDSIVNNCPTRTPIREGALSLDLALVISESAASKSPIYLG